MPPLLSCGYSLTLIMLSKLLRRFLFLANRDYFQVFFGQIVSDDQYFIQGEFGLDRASLERRGFALYVPAME